jgi:hypothetical protein
MLGSLAEDTKIVGGFTVDHNFFDSAFQEHPGHTLECIFKTTVALFDFSQMMVECIRIIRHFSSSGLI